MFMRKKTLGSLALASFLAFGVASSNAIASNDAPIQQVNAIAAIVNKSVITEYQLDQAVDNVKKHIRESHMTPPPDDVIRKQVLQQMIDEELQIQMADRAGIKVTDKELNFAISNIAKGNKISVATLMQRVKQQGESAANFRRDIRKQMLVSKVQREAVAGKFSVTDAQVNQAIQKFNSEQRSQKSYHLADILVATPDDADKTQLANARHRAEDIYKKLKKGANFGKLAKLESDNTNGPSDGDLGWKSGNELPDLFLDQVNTLKTGEISKPIEAGNGFHIIKVLGVKNSDKTLSRQQARLMLEEKAFHKAAQKWLKGLRKSAYIKVNQ